MSTPLREFYEVVARKGDKNALVYGVIRRCAFTGTHRGDVVWQAKDRRSAIAAARAYDTKRNLPPSQLRYWDDNMACWVVID